MMRDDDNDDDNNDDDDNDDDDVPIELLNFSITGSVSPVKRPPTTLTLFYNINTNITI